MLLSDLERSSAFSLKAVRPRARKRHLLPLSMPQLGIWFAQQIDPESAAYSIGEYIEIRGHISLAVFEQALRRSVVEAETLHLRFSEQAELPGQRVGSHTAWSLPVIDLSGERDPRRVAEAWMQADLARPIGLTEGPLFRFALFKASADRFFWYKRYHHIVMDGLSMWLLARRVAHLYTSLEGSNCSPELAFGSVELLLAADATYRASEKFL